MWEAADDGRGMRSAGAAAGAGRSGGMRGVAVSAAGILIADGAGAADFGARLPAPARAGADVGVRREPPGRLAERLSRARRHHVVGRAQELALFRDALAAGELPFHLLQVVGPGGIGKSTLLREFAHACREAGVPVVHVDGRDVAPTPAGFRAALGDRGAADLARPGRVVLLVDTYDALAPLDAWLRERFLPEQSADVLTVLAGRESPLPGWRGDPGWRSLVRAVHLRNLAPDDGRRYLERRGVPAARHDAALAFTHGHPLALSLVADRFEQRPDLELDGEDAPELVRELLGRFTAEVPGPQHRAALEACALVRALTEALLADMLAVPDAHAAFEWLRGLSFIESGPHGLFPHDLARTALAADLRWRNPDWCATLHRRARAYYAARLHQARGAEQRAVLLDCVHLHRDSRAARPYFAWHGTSGLQADALHPSDVPALVAMTARHEGAASARLAAHWLARAPGAATVFRDPCGAPAGWVLALSLGELPEEELAEDPGTRAAWRHAREHAPLRAGERATLVRFWMARDTHQAVSPVQSLAFLDVVQRHLRGPAPAVTLVACADAAFWGPAFGYVGLARLPHAAFEVAGRRQDTFAHDWRATPPDAWLAALGAPGSDAGGMPAAAAPAAAAAAVLDEAAFASAVHEALREFTSPRALRASPLLRTRVVGERAGAAADEARRAAALQELLRAAAGELRADPRRAGHHDALRLAYLHPAPSQERAAEQLRVSFSTFRRHLKAGVAHVSEALWQWELDGSAGPGTAADAR